MNTYRGFTLVNLLFVLVLIILLVAMLVPEIRMSREEASSAVCATNLKGLDTTAYLYAQSASGKYPIGWRHEAEKWDVADKSHVTPEDSFALLVHEGLLPLKSLICPVVGGQAAEDEWELVGLGGDYKGDPGAAAEVFIHHAYQDVGVGDGKNYLPGPHVGGGWPIFADRGERLNPAGGYYQLTGNANAIHNSGARGGGCRGTGKGLKSQMVVGGGHGVTKEFNDARSECLVGYVDGELGDNIYTDTIGVSDTYLLSSEAQTGKK